jgi:hypothetical protein
MNQLWRNQLLAKSIENRNQDPYDKYKEVTLSVVYHPNNHYLEKTLVEYENLINHGSAKFSYFKSNEIIDNVDGENNELQVWVN